MTQVVWTSLFPCAGSCYFLVCLSFSDLGTIVNMMLYCGQVSSIQSLHTSICIPCSSFLLEVVAFANVYGLWYDVSFDMWRKGNTLLIAHSILHSVFSLCYGSLIYFCALELKCFWLWYLNVAIVFVASLVFTWSWLKFTTERL